MHPGDTAPPREARDAPSFAELFAGLPIAILVIDPAGCVANANGECELLLNLSERAMHGHPLANVLTSPPGTGDDQGRAMSAFDFDIGTERTGKLRVDYYETAIADRPGWRVIALHPSGGSRRVGQSAERSGTRAAIGAAAMLAHEIKNPLSGIRGAAQLLAGEGAGDELTSLITTEVDRIAALIDRMQDFTDQRPLRPAPANIYPLIDHARRVAQTGFARDISIEESFDPSLPPVMVDGDALLQILINLLKNAAEALDDVKAPRILLSTAYRHGLAVDAGPGQPRRRLPIELCVIDNGAGAPADITDHLFNPFVSGKPEGQGLGLALVDKLVRDMGGVVQYAREGVPEMTIFRILLARGE
ncbi:ATP-binding protein [Sphingomonas bacterium]|uniref:two-component system sensor histidine kinase NtrB n=1 Tax=Sphingomonas bacterium TaxID=1895847 RepID=UPI0026042F06|nr:ATP-binding protein [Sphingomonas bacterium]MDB5679251.1 sensor histidine kinase [Sphingomonas bacterium]MDB5711054.1 two-component sensor histidine kinase [Sphingomonas bacterium]